MDALPTELINTIGQCSIEVALILAITAKHYNASLHSVLANAANYATMLDTSICLEIATIYVKYALSNAIINNTNNKHQMIAMLALIARFRKYHIIGYKLLCTVIARNYHVIDTFKIYGRYLININERKAAQATIANFYVKGIVPIYSLLYTIIPVHTPRSIEYITRICAHMLILPETAGCIEIMRILRYHTQLQVNDKLMQYVCQIPLHMVNRRMIYDLARIVEHACSGKLLNEYLAWRQLVVAT